MTAGEWIAALLLWAIIAIALGLTIGPWLKKHRSAQEKRTPRRKS